MLQETQKWGGGGSCTERISDKVGRRGTGWSVQTLNRCNSPTRDLEISTLLWDCCNRLAISSFGIFNMSNIQDVLTMVVSVMDPKLLMKILQVTFTGGPEDRADRPK